MVGCEFCDPKFGGVPLNCMHFLASFPSTLIISCQPFNLTLIIDLLDLVINTGLSHTT